MTKMCAFDGCPNPASPKAAKGLCSSHYWQLHKGRPLTPLSYRRNVTQPWLEAHVNYNIDDCLIWPFQRLQNDGRAAVRAGGKQTLAARVMCQMAHGKPPTPKHEAAHSCGKGHLGCVNSRHLRWATPIENKADMLAHGTRPRGETIPWSIISEERVLEIRALAVTASKAAVARRFGIKPAHVGKIVRREIWRHV